MSKTMQSQDGVGLLQMGDTLIVYWSQPATLERWRYQLKTMNATAAAHPSGILVLVVISAVDTLPNVAVREEMQSALRRFSTRYFPRRVIGSSPAVSCFIVPRARCCSLTTPRAKRSSHQLATSSSASQTVL